MLERRDAERRVRIVWLEEPRTAGRRRIARRVDTLALARIFGRRMHFQRRRVERREWPGPATFARRSEAYWRRVRERRTEVRRDSLTTTRRIPYSARPAGERYIY